MVCAGLDQHSPNLDHCVATSHQKLPRRHRLSGEGTHLPPLPRSRSLPDARFRRGMMRRPLSQSTGLFQLDRLSKAGHLPTLWLSTPVLRYPSVVIAAGMGYTRPQ